MTDSAAQRARAELIERLNILWRVAGPEPSSTSWPQRVLWEVRRTLARLLRPQETFNSAVVQYLNASVATIELALDRAQRASEAIGARERRLDEAIDAIRLQHGEIQTALGVTQQALRTMSKEAGRSAAAGAPAQGPGAPAAVAAPSSGSADALSHAYVGFEDQFRGPADEIRGRLADYVPLFADASNVLDIGCGRGEFLELLAERGVTARGIDLNEAMVEVCRAKGLDAARADALSYLQAQPDGSLGGLFAAQVVEHLEPAYLTRLIDIAFDKLRPGSPIVLETINPACWFAFFESYIRDITHVRPLHPDTLKFLLIAGGFQQVDIRYRAPYPEQGKLQPVAVTPALADIAPTLNENAEKLNRLLFTYLDYAAVARRSG
jgi:O-antigen chain-terminating methyltransferase